LNGHQCWFRVGSVGVAGVEENATAAVCLDGPSDEWVGFAGADLGRGVKARVDFVAGAVYVNGVDTIWLARRDDEPCHTRQEEGKGKGSSETHFDGCEVFELSRIETIMAGSVLSRLDVLRWVVMSLK
jgi:hypothetical protein